MYGIFEDKDNVAVLVEGSPGIGKTTFSLKIAYDWAKEQIPKGCSFPEFVVVLLLKCRDIDGDIMEAIVEQLLPGRMEETVKKEFMDFIEDFHYQEKVLIILVSWMSCPRNQKVMWINCLTKRSYLFAMCWSHLAKKEESQCDRKRILIFFYRFRGSPKRMLLSTSENILGMLVLSIWPEERDLLHKSKKTLSFIHFEAIH